MPNSSYFGDSFVIKMPSAALGNTNAPIFAGVSSSTPDVDSSLTLTWSAATGVAQNPIRYRVYVAFGTVTAATLFASTNYYVAESDATSIKLYSLPNGDHFISGEAYTVGVRAESAVGIAETNNAIITTTVLYNLYTLVQNTYAVSV